MVISESDFKNKLSDPAEKNNSVRDEIVIALSKELMGPRNGYLEKMKNDPRLEYIVGILEPESYQRKSKDDLLKKTNSDLTERTTENNRGVVDGHPNEDEPDLNLENEAFFSGIDPRALPKSIGLSFMLESNEPSIDVCATWARYKQVDESVWERVPNFITIRNYSLGEGNMPTISPKDGVQIDVRCEKIQNSTWYVSVHLTNRTELVKKSKMTTWDLIFQPQIRIKIGVSSVLVPLPDIFSDQAILEEKDRDETSVREESNLHLLYRDRSALGRGYHCGVIWNDVDPESKSESYKRFENAPFAWIDLQTVDPASRETFSNSDIRTDFFPVYSVLAAVDNLELGRFSASSLSELNNAENLDLLELIPEKYDTWIKQQCEKINSSSFKAVAKENLKSCQESSNRIRQGIDILRTNHDARLAFSFMNKAMEMQSTWTKGRGSLHWKPFQIAFILLTLESIIDKKSPSRKFFDLLWYPTGGGKTEAYLGLAVFTMAYRRLTNGESFDGVSVLSRYTLRLLTIQQFRRALKAILACEKLRVENWHPQNSGKKNDRWGKSKFSIGLWVGQSVSPNNLMDLQHADSRGRPKSVTGAISILREPNMATMSGDPAQVLNCPVCNEILAIPPSGIKGKQKIFWIFKSSSTPTSSLERKFQNCIVHLEKVHPLSAKNYFCSEFLMDAPLQVSRDEITQIWEVLKKDLRANEISCFSPIYPGYFPRKAGIFRKDIDFEIRCPNPKCDINSGLWHEDIPTTGDGSDKKESLEPFRHGDSKFETMGIPIPAYTVDDQIYHRCPSMIVATVDKLARLPFEPKGAALFGNVNLFDSNFGYYRDGSGNGPNTGGVNLEPPVVVQPFPPPDLIIQDELHLIEGPLGSMVGLYEGAVDLFTMNSDGSYGKYVASTATIREAPNQILSVYDRDFKQFPPVAITASNNFFSTSPEKHPRDDVDPGRLYVGICTPGVSAQTALTRIWSTVLQTTEDTMTKFSMTNMDRFRTVIGYFNAIRELSTAVGLFRQDIPEWMETHRRSKKRELGLVEELSSRIDSRDLPNILDRLEKGGSEAIAGVFATSMFGTGVDINRLGFMIVHGQPKTTAHYIQSTGRVGRSAGGLVITFLRATKPRDLDHYEFFIRYHRAMQRYVEPITVAPFSVRAMERALGPIAVMLLRNSRSVSGIPTDPAWSLEARTGKHSSTKNPVSGSRLMSNRKIYKEILSILDFYEQRSRRQPKGRRPSPNDCYDIFNSEIGRWASCARNHPDDLLYWESAYLYHPRHPVVLGDAQHARYGLDEAYENAPQSMREVEPTTRFDG